MNKSIMLSLHHKWLKMMQEGNKLYEFRGNNVKNWESGTVVEIYESKGKVTSKTKLETDKILGHFYSHEGQGLVVAKFVVGDKTYDYHEGLLTAHSYEVLSTLEDEGIVKYNKEDDNFSITNKGKSIGYDNQPYAIEITNFEMYDTPRKITEFVSYSKYQKMLKNAIQSCHKLPYCEKFNNFDCMTCETLYEDNNLYLTKAPQSFCYVVGDEQ